MKDLTLSEALNVLKQMKTGESLPVVTIGGVEYFPRKTVKFLRGLSNEIENTELVVTANTKKNGIRNIDSDQLDFPFLPIGVRMNFQDAAVGLTAVNAAYESKPKPYWRNGEIKISQDGLLTELPVSVIANGYSATSVKDDFYPISPFLIRPKKQFNIQTALAGVPEADAYSLEIEGIEFVKNARN